MYCRYLLPVCDLPFHCRRQIFFNYLFLFGCAGSSLPRRVFSSCGEWVLLCVMVRELLITVASLVAECKLQGMQASVVAAHVLSICNSWNLENRLSSCDAWAYLICCKWYLPGPRIEPMSPAMADGFFTTEPPGKHRRQVLLHQTIFILILPINYPFL